MGDRILYSVVATLPDEALAGEYMAWLAGGHVQGVIDGGAESGVVVRLDPESGEQGIRVMSQYVFGDRAAFDRYEREAAPALRADGLARFGAETGKGVTFQRSVGVIAGI